MDIGKIIKIGDRRPEPIFIPQPSKERERERERIPSREPAKKEPALVPA